MEKLTLPNLEEYTKPKGDPNYRRDMLRKFQTRLNEGEYKITGRGLAFKLVHVKTEFLHEFLKACEQANNFSKYFYYSLRIKNRNNES